MATLPVKFLLTKSLFCEILHIIASVLNIFSHAREFPVQKIL